MSFFGDYLSAKYYIIKVLVGSFIVVGIPYVLIVNWPYWMNEIDPYSNLDGKVAVDGIDLELYGFSGDENDIYLVDTIRNSFRQLTSDTFYNGEPFISLEDNKVYFYSNKPHDLGAVKRNDYLYAYSMTTHKIEAVQP
jgi:hypothetical protein